MIRERHPGASSSRRVRRRRGVDTGQRREHLRHCVFSRERPGLERAPWPPPGTRRASSCARNFGTLSPSTKRAHRSKQSTSPLWATREAAESAVTDDARRAPGGIAMAGANTFTLFEAPLKRDRDGVGGSCATVQCEDRGTQSLQTRTPGIRDGRLRCLPPKAGSKTSDADVANERRRSDNRKPDRRSGCPALSSTRSERPSVHRAVDTCRLSRAASRSHSCRRTASRACRWSRAALLPPRTPIGPLRRWREGALFALAINVRSGEVPEISHRFGHPQQTIPSWRAAMTRARSVQRGQVRTSSCGGGAWPSRDEGCSRGARRRRRAPCVVIFAKRGSDAELPTSPCGISEGRTDRATDAPALITEQARAPRGRRLAVARDRRSRSCRRCRRETRRMP